MKKITQEDKQDFREIQKVFNRIKDEETRAYLMGYAHGLRERKNLPAYRKNAK